MNNYINQIQDQIADSNEIVDIMDYIDYNQIVADEAIVDEYYDEDQEA